MRYAGRGAPFGIEQQEGKALGAIGHVRPGERRRNILTHAIRASLLVAARVFCGQDAVVLNADEDRVNTSAAHATDTATRHEAKNPLAVKKAAILRFMTFPPLVSRQSDSS